MLVVQNVTHEAEKAKDKKAALGTDVVIENFTTEDINAFDVIDDFIFINHHKRRQNCFQSYIRCASCFEQCSNRSCTNVLITV